MESIFREMFKLSLDAERRGIAPTQVTFVLNRRGMRRYFEATEQLPEASQLLAHVGIVFDGRQEADVTTIDYLN